MKDAERKQVVQQLRDKTNAILQRDVRVLNGLDNLMAKADTPREDNPTTREGSTCPAG